MAEDDEFEVLGASRSRCEPSEVGQESVEDAEHDGPGWRHQPWSAPTRDFPGGTGAEIVIENFDFGSPLVVGAGAAVGVVNADGVGHTWTSVDDVFDSGFLEPGDGFEFWFEESGEFVFFCSIHPSMKASITVGS